MPAQEVLILAMSKMKSGICTAGFTREADAITGWRWVRPMKAFDTLLPGDMAGASGRLFQCGDVVAMNLLAERPDPPHIEDWTAEFARQPPRLLRRLEGERRARLLAEHLDRAPEDVLVYRRRSLCLARPEQLWATFSLDAYSGKYEARLGFLLPGDANHPRATSERGVPVTDLKWRALGRAWLGEQGGMMSLRQEELLQRLGAEAIYLTTGLSRQYQGEYWPLVVGVHVAPDYDMEVDPANL